MRGAYSHVCLLYLTICEAHFIICASYTLSAPPHLLPQPHKPTPRVHLVPHQPRLRPLPRSLIPATARLPRLPSILARRRRHWPAPSPSGAPFKAPVFAPRTHILVSSPVALAHRQALRLLPYLPGSFVLVVRRPTVLVYSPNLALAPSRIQGTPPCFFPPSLPHPISGSEILLHGSGGGSRTRRRSVQPIGRRKPDPEGRANAAASLTQGCPHGEVQGRMVEMRRRFGRGISVSRPSSNFSAPNLRVLDQMATA